jgi:phosphatidate cytidylyltransferase
LKSDGDHFDEPTGELPVVSPEDPRIVVTGADIAGEIAEPAPVVDPTTLLPHWTDQPTGAVPVVVARETPVDDDPWAAIPAPAWREGEADWVAHEEQFDASFLSAERPGEATFAEVEESEDVRLDEAPRPEPAPEIVSRPRRSLDNPLAGRAVRARRGTKGTGLSTATGVAMGLFAAVFFVLGPLPVAVLATAVLVMASAEVYAGFRAAGSHPATTLGLAGVVVLAISAYLKGPAAIVPTLFLFFASVVVWFIAARRKPDVMDGVGASLFTFFWVGVAGSFALTFASPHVFTHRHGLGYLFGAIVLTVANDTGALFIGRWIGSTPLAPTISPNKTREGFIGAAVVTVLVGLIVLPQISVWSYAHGFEAAILVSFVAPCGDLLESMVKRTFAVKDLGRTLPGHGGIIDRVDGLLFVLPTLYYFCHVAHLS